MSKRIMTQQIARILIYVLMIVLSVTVISDKLSSPEFHSETIRVLEEQKADALALNVAITVASTALSAIPDDTATPIADKLAGLSLPMFMIVTFIYLEIFLLTSLGWIASSLLFPASCLLGIGYVLCRRDVMMIWSKKLLIFSLALAFLIPISTAVTSHVENTFSETVNQKLHAAYHVIDAAESEEEEENTNAFLSFFSNLGDSVASLGNSFTSLVDRAKNMLGTVVDAVAVLLITSCVIPVVTLILLLKAVKFVLNIDISVRYLVLSPSKGKQKMKTNASCE